MRRLNHCTAFLLAISGRALAQGPAPRAIPDEPSCAKCVISMRHVVTLGTDDGVGSLNGKPMSVNVDSRGRYWIFQELEPPTVFHSDGRVDRVIGRKGSGPGEFRSGNRGIVVGDSMLVLDWQESRATMMGPDLKPGRIIRLRPGIGDVKSLRWPTLLVTHGFMSDSRPPNSTLHRISLDNGEARLLTSFGPQGTGGSMGNVEVGQILGEAREGIWSAYWNRPRMTKWNSDGKPLAALTRRYDWYTGDTPSSAGTPTTPPKPRTGALIEDAEGLLWVFIHTPAPTWKEGWEAPPIRYPGGGTEYATRKMRWDKLYGTYVEVIDPSSARVVTTHGIDGYVMEALPDRRAALYRVDGNGIPRVQIVAFTLSGR
jgi:hypothetical protein